MKEPFLKPGTPGRSITVFTPWGRESYQIWLDNSPPGWVARIVTLPNRIWAHPGGREVLKFHGNTAKEAESAAVRYIEDECIRTGKRVSPAVLTEETPSPPAPTYFDTRPAPRMARRLLVRFGAGEPQLPGVTANLSETGLFIITDRPAPVGAPVRIDLRFPEGPVQLDGRVVWARHRREEGRSVGFGVMLTHKPVEYARRLHTLHTESLVHA